MSIPQPVRLFHITAIGNLKTICREGALLAKNVVTVAGLNYQNIAHGGAQGARADKTVPVPPGGTVHDFVPFYFAPRSPMLSAIHNGKVEGCQVSQQDIVHFETTVDRVTAGGEPFVFFERNATLAYSRAFTDLTRLDTIAWDLLTEEPKLDGFCKYFQNRYQVERYVDRMERRMAEFMVRDRVPLSQFTRVGVCNVQQARLVLAILQSEGVTLPVVVMPDWYFLNQ